MMFCPPYVRSFVSVHLFPHFLARAHVLQAPSVVRWEPKAGSFWLIFSPHPSRLVLSTQNYSASQKVHASVRVLMSTRTILTHIVGGEFLPQFDCSRLLFSISLYHPV